MPAATESEKVFEQYLEGQELKWTRLPEADSPRPDYGVRYQGGKCLFEVKEFDDPATEPIGGFDPCPAVRQKIHRARRQFEEYKDYPCAVVLWNSKSILRDLSLPVVLSAAFGRYIDLGDGFQGDVGEEPLAYAFDGGEAALGPNSNTTVSAIVILSHYQWDQVWVEAWRRLSHKKQRGEPIQPSDQDNLTQQVANEFVGTRYLYQGTIRAVVLENPYARMPFPPDLFMGPFDQRWPQECGRFRPCFMGSELTRLKHSRVPFVYL
jgi:hypothetical protein